MSQRPSREAVASFPCRQWAVTDCLGDWQPATRREEWMAFRQRKNPAAIPRTVPAFEHIVTEASDSFLWRLDDYPWERNVWNFHPEYEIHLLRKSSGVALVGDHIGEFGPGYLSIVGGGLPHRLGDGGAARRTDRRPRHRPAIRCRSGCAARRACCRNCANWSRSSSGRCAAWSFMAAPRWKARR